jgi:hypothetical protein
MSHERVRVKRGVSVDALGVVRDVGAVTWSTPQPHEPTRWCE